MCRKLIGDLYLWASKESRIELKKELNCDAVVLKASFHYMGNSGIGIVLQSCPTLRQMNGF